MNLDLFVFGAYLVLVAAVGIVASRKKKKESDDYFLAGRNLTWWIIGGSLIAANISTHHFVGMAGRGFEIGLAIASYEWIGAIALVLYAIFFLPYYLKSRITTMPEFLERRFSRQVRLAYAIICLIAYIVIELAAVLYTGSIAIQQFVHLDNYSWALAILCIVGGGYTIYGGFKSVAYTDIIQVTVLILGGLIVTVLGLCKVGAVSPGHSATALSGLQAVLAGAHEKFHMVRPWNDAELPWIGVFFGGMWLTNIYYWGCNQFITQRTLAARSLWQGQMGVVFAAFLKLLVPVLVVLPGIIAFHLYNGANGLLRQEHVVVKSDLAFLTLVQQLLPAGLVGLVMAGVLGCVISHIASLFAACSSIITFDIYSSYINKTATSAQLIRVGRYSAFVILLLSTAVAFLLKDIHAIFLYIQEAALAIYPTMCIVFLAGFFYKRANAKGCLIATAVVPTLAVLYTLLYMFVDPQALGLPAKMPFLNRAMIDGVLTFSIIWSFRTRGDKLPPEATIDRTLAPDVIAALKAVHWYCSFRFWATLLILTVISLYVYFH
jgi:SSS family solute:Na+ symporter